jgi:hypothetical protein
MFSNVLENILIIKSLLNLKKNILKIIKIIHYHYKMDKSGSTYSSHAQQAIGLVLLQ